MLVVKDILVASLDLDYLDVFWSLQDTYEEVDMYNMYVLRSEAPEGPYDAVAGPFEDEYTFRDTTIRLLLPNRRWFYRIKIEHKDSGETKTYPEVGGATIESAPSKRAIEVARKTRLHLEEHGGRKLVVLPRRTWGQLCTCVDRATDQVLRNNCETCYGTRYVGGYHKPIMVMGSIARTRIPEQATQTGNKTRKAANAMFADYPLLKAKWLVVESENTRWRVEDITPTEVLRHTVQQMPTLVEVLRGDLDYKVPVLIPDLENHKPNPVREMKKAFSLDQVDKSISDLLVRRGLV